MEQHFKNLDSLLFARRKIFDTRAWVYLQAIVRNQFIEFSLNGVQPKRKGRGLSPTITFCATVNAPTSIRSWCTMAIP